jgi:hypothetical protein
MAVPLLGIDITDSRLQKVHENGLKSVKNK